MIINGKFINDVKINNFKIEFLRRIKKNVGY